MEQDSDLADLRSLIAELQESNTRISKKLKTITSAKSDLEIEIKNLQESKYDLEARIRVLESEDIEKIKHELYRIESVLGKMQSMHDDRKQNWNTIINFVVQLVWVSMAAWLLTKLGLQGPL